LSAPCSAWLTGDRARAMRITEYRGTVGCQLIWAALVALVCLTGSVAAQSRWALGTPSRPWARAGEFEAIDDSALPGWIQPQQTTRDINLLNQLYAAGQLYAGKTPSGEYRPGVDARIWTLNLPITSTRDLLLLADGLQDTLRLNYFNRLASNAGVSFVVDLGIPYPVSEVAFYPLRSGSSADYFVRGYQLFGNDGDPNKVDRVGEPVFSALSADATNPSVVVRDDHFPPQHLRYVKLRISAPNPFELDQLEIRGEGYVSSAAFTSTELDLGDIGNFGRMLWAAEIDPGSELALRTRVRRDAGAEWSAWSEVYQHSGSDVSADGPARYLQVQAQFTTSVTTQRSRLDSLAIEYSQPTMGRRVDARIEPRTDVQLGQLETFTYTITPLLGAPDIGFDTIELDTPTVAVLRRVSVAGVELSGADYQVEAVKGLLRVRLLGEGNRITRDAQAVQLVFDDRVLIYGTVMGGRAIASWRADVLPQRLEAQSSGYLTVLGAAQSLGRVLGSLRASPQVFTPNGDGVNDDTAIVFQIAQVIGDAPLLVEVLELSGHHVRSLWDGPVSSDAFAVPWDALDDAGSLVPPGIYLVRAILDGDWENYVQMTTVAVAY
jgi:hypothetical protein